MGHVASGVNTTTPTDMPHRTQTDQESSLEDSSNDGSPGGGNSLPDAGCADDPIEAPPLGRRRRCRTQFNDAGLRRLEETFITDPYPDVTTREELADLLSVTEDRVQVWFQNHRSKQRRDMAKGSKLKVTVTPVECSALQPPHLSSSPEYLHPSIPRKAKPSVFDMVLLPGVSNPMSKTVRNSPAVVSVAAHQMKPSQKGTVHPLLAGLCNPFPARPRVSHLVSRAGTDVTQRRRQPGPLQSSTPGQPPISSSKVSSTVSMGTPQKPTQGTVPLGRSTKNTASRPSDRFKPRRPWEDASSGQPKQNGVIQNGNIHNDIHNDIGCEQSYEGRAHCFIPAGYNPSMSPEIYVQTRSEPLYFRPPFYPQPEMSFHPIVGAFPPFYPGVCGINSHQYGVHGGQFVQVPHYTNATATWL